MAMPAHRIGYARVSTRDQNLDLQLRRQRHLGCRTEVPARNPTPPTSYRLVRSADNHLRRAVRDVASSPGKEGPDLLLETGQQGEVNS